VPRSAPGGTTTVSDSCVHLPAATASGSVAADPTYGPPRATFQSTDRPTVRGARSALSTKTQADTAASPARPRSPVSPRYAATRPEDVAVVLSDRTPERARVLSHETSAPCRAPPTARASKVARCGGSRLSSAVAPGAVARTAAPAPRSPAAAGCAGTTASASSPTPSAPGVQVRAVRQGGAGAAQDDSGRGARAMRGVLRDRRGRLPPWRQTLQVPVRASSPTNDPHGLGTSGPGAPRIGRLGERAEPDRPSRPGGLEAGRAIHHIE
jgi:hypothetical protein